MIKKLKNQYKAIDREEQANVFTHGLMLIVALISTPFLIKQGSAFVNIVGLTSFCLGCILMLLSSTIYHLMTDISLKAKWQLLDHISIFVLISCSYTAFFIYHYNSQSGYQFLMLHWVISILGIVFRIITLDKYKWVSLGLYLILGCMVVFVFEQATCKMSNDVFNYLILGGLGYLIGVVFYVWEKLKFNHAIWHLGVNFGVISHFLALWHS